MNRLRIDLYVNFQRPEEDGRKVSVDIEKFPSGEWGWCIGIHDQPPFARPPDKETKTQLAGTDGDDSKVAEFCIKAALDYLKSHAIAATQGRMLGISGYDPENPPPVATERHANIIGT